jgi:hypothetical protein
MIIEHYEVGPPGNADWLVKTDCCQAAWNAYEELGFCDVHVHCYWSKKVCTRLFHD